MLLTYDQIATTDTATLRRAVALIEQFHSTVRAAWSLHTGDVVPTAAALAEVAGYAAEDTASVKPHTAAAAFLRVAMEPLLCDDGSLSVLGVEFTGGVLTDQRAVMLYELHRRSRTPVDANAQQQHEELLW
jgi:hypothetical protein